MVLNFVLENEACQANFYLHKTILMQQPFLHSVSLLHVFGDHC